MKKTCSALLLLGLAFLMTNEVAASSYKFRYKIRPGQIWQAEILSRTETSYMGNKSVTKRKNKVAYTIGKSSRSGWVAIKAKITSTSVPADEMMGLTRMTFNADLHTSGEIRNAAADIPENSSSGQSEIPPEMAAMQAQMGRMIGDAWLQTIFWFPEFPEETLSPGDEFEEKKHLKMGSAAQGFGTQIMSKTVYVLEEVSESLAYFSIKQRSVSKTSGAVGTAADTKSAGKGEAIFDLREGMWLEFTTKSRHNVSMGNIPGAGTAPGNNTVLAVNKITMEKQ